MVNTRCHSFLSQTASDFIPYKEVVGSLLLLSLYTQVQRIEITYSRSHSCQGADLRLSPFAMICKNIDLIITCPWTGNFWDVKMSTIAMIYGLENKFCMKRNV